MNESTPIIAAHGASLQRTHEKFREARISPTVWEQTLSALQLLPFRSIFKDREYLTAEGQRRSFSVVSHQGGALRDLVTLHTFAKGLVTCGELVRCCSIFSLLRAVRELETLETGSIDDVAVIRIPRFLVIYDFHKIFDYAVSADIEDTQQWLISHLYRGGALVLPGLSKAIVDMVNPELVIMIQNQFVTVQVA